jgi:hypothetical protein
VPADQLGEPGGWGLLRGEAGDRVDGLEADLPCRAMDTAPDDLDGLTGAGEEQVVDRADLQSADLGASVTSRACPVLEPYLLPGKDLQLLAEPLRVALHDHDVVGVPPAQIGGVVVLGVHGIAGHDDPGQVGQRVQEGLETRDLVGLR